MAALNLHQDHPLKYSKIQSLAQELGATISEDCNVGMGFHLVDKFAVGPAESRAKLVEKCIAHDDDVTAKTAETITGQPFSTLCLLIQKPGQDHYIKALAYHEISALNEMKEAVLGKNDHTSKAVKNLRRLHELERPGQAIDTAFLERTVSIARVLKRLVEAFGLGILGLIPSSVERADGGRHVPRFFHPQPPGFDKVEDMIRTWQNNAVQQYANHARPLVEAIRNGQRLPPGGVQLFQHQCSLETRRQTTLPGMMGMVGGDDVLVEQHVPHTYTAQQDNLHAASQPHHGAGEVTMDTPGGHYPSPIQQLADSNQQSFQLQDGYALDDTYIYQSDPTFQNEPVHEDDDMMFVPGHGNIYEEMELYEEMEASPSYPYYEFFDDQSPNGY